MKNSEDLALTTDYGTTVTAMIARGNVFGCQFHPEFKSRPMNAHPLFREFIGAAKKYAKGHGRS